MKMRFFLFACLLVLSSGLSAQIGPINIVTNAPTDTYTTSDGSLITSGLLRFGLFDETAYASLTSAQQLSFASVDSLFSELGTVQSSVDGDFLANSFVVPTQVVTDTGATAGDQLYVWVTNTLDPTLATEWGIFSSTNSLWELKAPPGFTVASASNVDVNVFGTTSLNLAPVPEPSHFALFFGALGLGFVLWRRRK